MIADLDESLRQLLVAELPVKNGEIDVSFDQPKREWSARVNRPTVNFFLYDLRENATLRQHQWERTSANGNGDSLAHLKRSPFRVDCFYMLTTWAAEPEDEHRLMSRVLMVLFRHPSFPAERLAGSLKTQPFEIPARLANHDRLTNPAEVWGSLDNELRPSVSYILTLAIDPWAEVTGPLVRTLILRSGQAQGVPSDQRLDPLAGALERNYMGGTVRGTGAKSGDAKGAPLAGITVALKDTGFVTQTDADGRYVFNNLPPGNYTLVAWPPKGKPQEKAIRLPASGSDYDLNLP